ncbi:MAG: acylphosphatase [Candidatus Woesearchaeota archaeon]
MQQYHIIVKGRVQGVNFRDFVRRTARELGLYGWVRNSGDDVEIIAQGKEEQLAKLVKQIRSGPPLARVDDIEYDVREPSKEFDSFQIRA